jgi:hypothetical protein
MIRPEVGICPNSHAVAFLTQAVHECDKNTVRDEHR